MAVKERVKITKQWLAQCTQGELIAALDQIHKDHSLLTVQQKMVVEEIIARTETAAIRKANA